MTSTRTLIFTTIIVALLCISCSERHSAFGNFKQINSHGWAYDDTIKIKAEGLDSTAVRNLNVAVRHSSEYQYRNLWLEVTYPVGNSLRCDTVNIVLADVYGRWLGKGFGPSYQTEVEVAHQVPIADSSQVYVRHIMRLDTLPHIEQVGIIITP